jgi:thioredoxin reductase (NADPH)
MDAGLHIQFGEILSIRPDGDDWRLDTDSGELTAGAVIAAVGSSLGRLGVAGEERLEGRGVSYCATCDGEFFRGQDVAVIGGGDSALDEALHLTEMARSIALIHRGDELHGAHVTQQRLLAHEHVRVLSGRTVRALHGEDQLDAITLGPAEGADGAAEHLDVTGIFIFTGLVPNTKILANLVPLDAVGHVPVDWSMATERPGLYAVGDIRQHSSRQLVSAAGDGATAALAVCQYLRRRLPQRSIGGR